MKNNPPKSNIRSSGDNIGYIDVAIDVVGTNNNFILETLS